MIDHLVSASERLPTWVRVTSMVALWPAAVLARVAYREPVWWPVTGAVFVVLSLFALWAHIPVFRFDGPLPFSELGVHVSGEVHAWERVRNVRERGDKDLEAVLDDGTTLRLRVRGARTREDFRDSLARYKPDAVAF